MKTGEIEAMEEEIRRDREKQSQYGTRIAKLKEICDRKLIPKPRKGKCPKCDRKLSKEKIDWGSFTFIHYYCACGYEYAKESVLLSGLPF